MKTHESGQESYEWGEIYESSQRGCATLPAVGLSYLLAGLGLLVLILSTVRMIRFAVGESDWAGSVADEIGLILIGAFAVAIGSIIANQYPTIEVVEGGLRVRVFLWRFVWRMVPWQDVQDIIVSPTRIHNLAYGPQTIVLVVVKRLTIWHRLLGETWGAGGKPVLLLHPDMSRREELIRTIAHHTKIRDFPELVDRMQGWK